MWRPSDQIQPNPEVLGAGRVWQELAENGFDAVGYMTVCALQQVDVVNPSFVVVRDYTMMS